ncbi:TRAP dicarboxylate transporter- DctP subunit [Dinoroseobacter shibae DFL 12 = DSM 16493]|jgi:TRAP-type C4-dicarboxylate transport system substrate-binding protein|uniref:TRAP dicarboxylate transporter-DctP subunit n=1 Tax=Dinoroseobacter shibae (strain DSM 16493 / NCIMB 14021 / DFL 12) TaxID=398580 RepID=A8LQF7_DINSH|nr:MULTISPECIES: TRAP transporter substrate-binding protein DctP [Dinoroseobacter]ABV92443.1 TRAP dicarboxylate transporter- DctP subunit [Dinoroseobacter shibae DFL 12 = DSM 16493]MDD9718300.1 TRAP transporter substrate-binding protein DctP [Dinoroseobacter sp. PD6]URF47386.1 TRAP transporter substrate-binding protein DctP [Dinoroseobacter shibae]URF51697.1 TRAP transporter substrate-binding protein DctP [Dinoroseobacter shibae]
MKHYVLSGALAAGLGLGGAAQATETLTAVHAFPTTLIYTQSFLEFVDKVNAAGEGVVQIEVRGGPEAIGMFQQPDAVRDGIVDMVYTPGSFYGGTVPEKDAMVASNLTAVEARENGGTDLMNQIHQEKMGVYYLGWFDSGVSYNLWTKDEPQFEENGDLSVEGIKLRGNAVYNAFFTEYLGAQVIDLPTTDVYAALERGVVDATGWTQIGLIDLKWNEFLNYRIEPNFFSTDLGVIVNLEKWESLSDEAKTILQDVAIQHERDSVEALRAKRDADFAALEEGGMQVVSLEGEAKERYLAAAREKTWERMRGLMAEHPSGDGNYDTLISLYYDPALD